MRRRVVLVGAGSMGRWHGTYALRAGARIVAVVDRDLEAARMLARRFAGARALRSDDDWTAETEVVHCCTPLASHHQVASQALAAGCHVLVEKPLTATADELEELLALAHRHQRRLAAVHQLPFQRGSWQLRRELDRLGEPIAAEYIASTAGAEGRDASGRRAVMREILPHPLSLFHALGFALPAAGTWQIVRSSDDELMMVSPETASGTSPLLTVRIGCRARPTRHQLRIEGSRASVLLDGFHGFRVWAPGAVGRREKIRRPLGDGARLVTTAAWNLCLRALRREPAYPGLRELIRTFYATIDTTVDKAVDTADDRSGPTLGDPRELRAIAQLVDRLRSIAFS